MKYLKSFIFVGLLVVMGSCIGLQDDKSSPNLPVGKVHLKGDVGVFTQYKLDKLSGNYQACLKALDQADINYTPVPDRVSTKGCDLTRQVTLDRSRYPYTSLVSGRCALIAAIVAWEDNVVQTNAMKYLGQDIAQITHYAMFSCRNIAGSSKRSEHAKANAIDVSAFTLKNGEKITVLNDWDDSGRKGQFLRAVFKDSCKIFTGALGPNYNAAHKDHFHFDMGTWNSCD